MAENSIKEVSGPSASLNNFAFELSTMQIFWALNPSKCYVLSKVEGKTNFWVYFWSYYANFA